MRQYLAILFLACVAQAAPTPVLVWSDEFDQAELPDTSRWFFESSGDGMGNKEAELYTGKRLANASVSNGLLHLTARREDTGTCWYGPCKFTSARLVTRGKEHWLYGRFEVRAKLTKGVGLWPAIWMLGATNAYGGWPGAGEIDIMESVGHEPTTVFGTIHTDSFNHVKGTAKGSTTTSSSMADSFHVYGLDWRPDSLFITFDGKPYFRFGNMGNWKAWPFDKPMYMLLNVAVGGSWGGAKGVDTSAFPQTMDVDWVRVSKVAWTQGPFSVQGRQSLHGHVEISPQRQWYDPLEKVVVRAVPDSGWSFFGWDSGASSNSPVDSFYVDRDIVVRANFLPEGEQIFNGDFSGGLMGWSFWNDASFQPTWVARDGMACIRPGGRDTANSWKVQFDWPGLAVTKNELYDLSFSAKSKVSRSLSTTILQDSDPYSSLATAWKPAITSSMSKYTHRFKINQSSAAARLEFDIASDTAEICLDSVSLKKVSTQSGVKERLQHAPALDIQWFGHQVQIGSPVLSGASWLVRKRDGSILRRGHFDHAGKARIEQLPVGILLFSATSSDGIALQKSLLVL